MPRNLILCMDGTGNEIGPVETNILKLYKGLQKRSKGQLAHYLPGIGTLDSPTLRGRAKQKLTSLMGLAFGYGLEDDVLDGYRFLCENYQHNRDPDKADRILIFGYSRGAYAARVLAGFIYNFGLLPPHQLHMAAQVFRAYRQISDDKDAQDTPDDYDAATTQHHDARLYQRLREYGAALDEVPVPIRYLGLFDTVSSIIRFRRPLHNLAKYQSLIELGTHANVDRNPSVQMVRHALAIDERRSLFRGQFWQESPHRPTRFNKGIAEKQDVRQMWFAGAHGDIAGQAPENEAGLGKITLLWMLDEMEAAGLSLEFKRGYIDRYIRGTDPNTRTPAGLPISKPDPKAELHPSMRGLWLIPEIIPKSFRRRDTRTIPWLGFYYLPLAEWRKIPDAHDIHPSAFIRREALDYDPPNLRGRSA